MRILFDSTDLPYEMVGIKSNMNKVYLCNQYGESVRSIAVCRTGGMTAIRLRACILSAYANGEKIFDVDEWLRKND